MNFVTSIPHFVTLWIVAGLVTTSSPVPLRTRHALDLANQRLHLGRKEVSHWQDAQRLTLTALVKTKDSAHSGLTFKPNVMKKTIPKPFKFQSKPKVLTRSKSVTESSAALSSSWRVCGGGWRQATRLPRASQTCSIGFMSGEHVGHSIRTIPSSKRKSSTRSEDLISISASSQRSISNDVEVCAPANGDATIHQHSPTTKSDTFVHERRIIPTATVSPDENTPIIRMNRKMGLVRKKNIALFISPPVHRLCCLLPAVATMP
ncbi:uncharacterized protein TNCV_523131 [Trichonephila clavipes]|nr:uncharacterized protein TNCV_523131 [Trichonephila clavipes]